MNVATKALYFFRASQKYKNWLEYSLIRASGQECNKLVLKNGVKIETVESARMVVDEIFFWQLYTPAPLFIEENDIVLDIGANAGVFTLFAASKTKNTVYAFEPFPANFEVLQRNIASNALQNVVAYNSAVSDTSGTGKLFVNPHDGKQNLLDEHILPEKIAKYKTDEDLDYLDPSKFKQYVNVSITTLQAFMDSNNVQKIDFLKLDCEGAEGAILFSTPDEYLGHVRKITMEFHDHLSQYSHDDIQKRLEEVGFTTQLKWDGISALGYLYGWRQ